MRQKALFTRIGFVLGEPYVRELARNGDAVLNHHNVTRLERLRICVDTMNGLPETGQFFLSTAF